MDKEIKATKIDKIMCFLGVHEFTVAALTYRTPRLTDYEKLEEYQQAWADGVKKMHPGRECENCGKVRWER